MDLSQLAAVLRENGDQVLNGLSKLSLSIKLLKELNESFSIIVEEREALSSTFQVINTSNSKVELLLDLQFLHDFIQRTVGLKLVDDSSEPWQAVSINKFKNLRLLEVHKVPVHKIIGLQWLRNQLQYLVAVRSLKNLKELFVNCGADKSQGFIWSELREAVLSYNNFESIDNSFEYVPWLQVLDLSHNTIRTAQPIDCLPNLKHLNLAFNYLEAVPVFRRELFRNLQVLILKSNYIEDLTGLLYLDNLVTLDLSCNCLVDHKSLNPLAHLAALQWLSLEGNPLSFHPEHRLITARYLHSITATVQFILDHSLLNKSERMQIGTGVISIKGRIQPTSIDSIGSELLNSGTETAANATDTAATAGVPPQMTRSQSMQRGRKVRDAVISDVEGGDVRDDKGDIVSPELLQSYSSVASLSAQNDHVETQKRIESLRDLYGEEWLKSQGGSIMQDILGIEKTPMEKLSSTPYEQDFLAHAAEVLEKRPELTVEPDKADVVSELSANNTFLTASESSVLEEDKNDAIETLSVGSSEEPVVEEEQEEDEEEHPYLAQIHCSSNTEQIEGVFIVLTDKYMKERDTITCHTRSKWLLEIISSCEIVSKNPTLVRIQFDTVRRNMQQREYILEEDEGQKFYRAVNDIMSQRPLSAFNQTIYSCMKCSLRFSRDNNSTLLSSGDDSNNAAQCPNCGSKLIFEVDDDSTPTNRSVALKGAPHQEERPESPSECSIASESESKPLAHDHVHVHVTADVHVRMENSTTKNLLSTNCSAASVQESNSSQISTEETHSSENVNKKYESDIEVISNPSQSSIEVLDDHFRPMRKRSSEERRRITAPSLGTIPDVVTPLPGTTSTTTSVFQVLQGGLTESSSSSSMTESVCTAYDAHTTPSRPPSGLANRPTIPEEKDKELEVDKNKGSLIASIFEGLFSGPTTGTKSASKVAAAKDDESEVKFTFTKDFSNVDHRIKYYLYQNVFEDEQENFLWILRCVLVNSGTSAPGPAQGCVVYSTHKVYFLHIKLHDSGDDLSEWLIKKESYKVEKLQSLFPLPWNQGVGLEMELRNRSTLHCLCLLQDITRTTNFLAFLAENPLPDSCKFLSAAPEREMLNLQHLLLSSHSSETSTGDSTLSLFSIFNLCSITKNNQTQSFSFGVLLVTASDLILLENITWLLSGSDKQPTVFTSQPLSNLLEMDLEDLTLEFHFLDEAAACEDIWCLQWETKESLNAAISAIRSPWEQLFSVPLQINYKVHSM